MDVNKFQVIKQIQMIKQIQDRRMWYRGVVQTHPGKFKDPSQIRCEWIYLSFMLDLKEETPCKASSSI